MTTIKEYVTAGATDPPEKLEKKEKLMVSEAVPTPLLACACGHTLANGPTNGTCNPDLTATILSPLGHTQASLPAYYEYAKFKFERGEYDDAYIFLNNYVTVRWTGRKHSPACLFAVLSAHSHSPLTTSSTETTPTCRRSETARPSRRCATPTPCGGGWRPSS